MPVDQQTAREKVYKNFNPFDLETWGNVGNKVMETAIGQDVPTDKGTEFKPGVFTLGLQGLGEVAKQTPTSSLVGIAAGGEKDPYKAQALATQSGGMQERELREKEAEANRNLKIQELLAAQKLKEKELETEAEKEARLRREKEEEIERENTKNIDKQIEEITKDLSPEQGQKLRALTIEQKKLALSTPDLIQDPTKLEQFLAKIPFMKKPTAKLRTAALEKVKEKPIEESTADTFGLNP